MTPPPGSDKVRLLVLGWSGRVAPFAQKPNHPNRLEVNGRLGDILFFHWELEQSCALGEVIK